MVTLFIVSLILFSFESCWGRPLDTEPKYSLKLNKGRSYYKLINIKLRGGSYYIQGIFVGSFNYDEQNGYLNILNGRFWEKRGGGGVIVALQYFLSIKKALEFLICSNEPSRNIVGPLGWYDHPGKKKTNKPAWVAFLRQRIRNFTLLQIEAWNLYSRVFCYVESDDVVFIKILGLLGGVSPFFRKQVKFS